MPSGYALSILLHNICPQAMLKFAYANFLCPKATPGAEARNRVRWRNEGFQCVLVMELSTCFFCTNNVLDKRVKSTLMFKMTTFASANYGRRQFDQSDTTKVQVVPRYSDTGTRTEYSCYTRDERQIISLLFKNVKAAATGFFHLHNNL
ncbi:hypothetical protein T4D_6951 [Trichinella pseudospiralis]|uniref:Uncharacterized protein n=1 Tax=Trichinella pseudospiralis TaxID=6337 RepID=A0A0V1F4W1_TRIPS|nr:hypothetical protein T4D_6951 [Trichinella pseudospiralis]